MKTLLNLLLLLFTISTIFAQSDSSIYDFKLQSLMGEEVDFAQFKGKKLLLVNVASKCGFTPQYKDLQELHEKYGDKITVVGIPANNFGKQEPGTHEEIAEFCEKNYGVTFLITEKISVTGDDMHPLYQFLSDKERNGVTDKSPNWNFCKYLIDENGTIIDFFPSMVKPLSNKIIGQL